MDAFWAHAAEIVTALGVVFIAYLNLRSSRRITNIETQTNHMHDVIVKRARADGRRQGRRDKLRP